MRDKFKVAGSVGLELLEKRGYGIRDRPISINVRAQAASSSGRRTVAMEDHEEMVRRHANGEPYDTVAYDMGFDPPTVKGQWKRHQMRVCGCSLLSADKPK